MHFKYILSSLKKSPKIKAHTFFPDNTCNPAVLWRWRPADSRGGRLFHPDPQTPRPQ